MKPDFDAFAQRLIYDHAETEFETALSGAGEEETRQLRTTLWKQLCLAISDDCAELLAENPDLETLNLYFSAVVLCRQEMLRAIATGHYSRDTDDAVAQAAEEHLETFRSRKNHFDIQVFFVELERILRDNPTGEYMLFMLPRAEILITTIAAETMLKLSETETVTLSENMLYRVRLCLEMARY